MSERTGKVIAVLMVVLIGMGGWALFRMEQERNKERVEELARKHIGILRDDIQSVPITGLRSAYDADHKAACEELRALTDEKCEDILERSGFSDSAAQGSIAAGQAQYQRTITKKADLEAEIQRNAALLQGLGGKSN